MFNVCTGIKMELEMDKRLVRDIINKDMTEIREDRFYLLNDKGLSEVFIDVDLLSDYEIATLAEFAELDLTGELEVLELNHKKETYVNIIEILFKSASAFNVSDTINLFNTLELVNTAIQDLDDFSLKLFLNDLRNTNMVGIMKVLRDYLI